MSEYLRLVKQHRDQLDGTVYSLKNGKIVTPSITNNDRLKIVLAAGKNGEFLPMLRIHYEAAKRKGWIREKDGKEYYLPGGPREIRIIN